MDIKKKDLGAYIEAPIRTHKMLLSEGRVTGKMRPTQISLRLPASQVEWLRRRVDGNINYVVSQIMEKGIKDLNSKLAKSDYDVENYK